MAGTAALVLAAQPALTPAELRTFLTSKVRPFPTTGGDNGDGTPVDQCFPPNPIGQSQFDQLQCYCTTSTCGAGMLDAGAAVSLAAVGVVPRVTVSPASPRAGQALTLGGATSLVASGRTIASYRWLLVSGGGIVTGFTGATDGASASVTPNGVGQFRISLTVTDSAGAQATSESVIAVQAAAVPGGGTGSSSGGGALGAGWLVLLLLAVAALRFTASRESRA